MLLRICCTLVALAVALPAFADDREKMVKEVAERIAALQKQVAEKPDDPKLRQDLAINGKNKYLDSFVPSQAGIWCATAEHIVTYANQLSGRV